MTIETQSTKIRFKGNGSTTAFTVPFPVYRGEHLSLYLVPQGKDPMDLLEKATLLTGGYSVTGAGSDSVRVVMDQPLATGDALTISRLVPLIQPTDIQNASRFDAEVVEGADDYQEMQIQQLAEAVGRAIKVPVTSDTDPEDFWRELLDACKAAQEALKMILEMADPTALNSYAFNVRRSVIQRTAVPRGGVLELPVYYYPRRNILFLSVDGMVCTPKKGDNLDSGERQYEEIGDDANSLSNLVRVDFPIEEGALVDAWVVASNLYKELATIENMALESTRQAQAAAGSAAESLERSLAAAGNALAAESSAAAANSSATAAGGSESRAAASQVAAANSEGAAARAAADAASSESNAESAYAGAAQAKADAQDAAASALTSASSAAGSANAAQSNASSAANSAASALGAVESIRSAFPLPGEGDAGKKLVALAGGVAEWRGNARLISLAGEREEDIAEDEAFAVPEYIAGACQLDVRLDGMGCDEGVEYSETGEPGGKSAGIIWLVPVPVAVTISVYVRV